MVPVPVVVMPVFVVVMSVVVIMQCHAVDIATTQFVTRLML